MVRGVTVEDFGDLSQAGIGEMIFKRREPLGCLGTGSVAATVHFDASSDERPQQPRPHCPLMVCAVAASGIAGVASAILWVAGSKTAQAVGSEQVLLNFLDHALRPIG